MNDWTPDPQESGWLEPPRKLPPTAIGVATPPPPRGPDRRSPRRTSRLRRIATVIGFSLATTGAGVVAGIGLPVSALLEIGAGLTALELAMQYVRRRRRILETIARAA
jgi:hypothetical protein